MKFSAILHRLFRGGLLLLGLSFLPACVTSGSRSSFGTWHEHRLPTPESHVVSLPAPPSRVSPVPIFEPYKAPGPNDPTTQILEAQKAEADAQALARGETVSEPVIGLLARLNTPRQIGSVTRVPLRTTAANYLKDENNITLLMCQATGYAPRSPSSAGYRDYAEVVVENTLDLFAVRRALVLHRLPQPIEITLDTTIPKHGTYSAARSRRVIEADNQLFIDIASKLRLNRSVAGGQESWGAASFDVAGLRAAAARIPPVGGAAIVKSVAVRVK